MAYEHSPDRHQPPATTPGYRDGDTSLVIAERRERRERELGVRAGETLLDSRRGPLTTDAPNSLLRELERREAAGEFDPRSTNTTNVPERITEPTAPSIRVPERLGLISTSASLDGKRPDLSVVEVTPGEIELSAPARPRLEVIPGGLDSDSTPPDGGPASAHDGHIETHDLPPARHIAQ